MKMKKLKLIISILFIVLIVAEVCILFYLLYCDSMNGTNDDIFGNTFDFAIVTVVGTLILIPELEIWHIILYFVSDKKCKKVYKTVMNSIEGILVVGILFFMLNEFIPFLPYDPFDNTVDLVWSIITIIYAALKFIHFIVWSTKEE